MKEDNFFSFVLPAYKAKFLRKAIQSILNQSYSHFELIIVDDASPENLKDIVSSFNDSRIQYHRNDKNLGGVNLVKNWNHSISFATGDYMILASDDDTYEKEFLSEINKLIDKYPDIDLYKARTQKIDEEEKIIDVDPHFFEHSSMLEFLYHRRKGMISCVSNHVFRRSTLKAIGNFIEFPVAWHSDAATVAIMAKKGVATTNQILFSFRSSGINISSKKDVNLDSQKLKATKLYHEWFDSNISFQPENEYEKFLAKKIIEKNNQDKEYMCSMLFNSHSFFQALSILKEIHNTRLLSNKQLIKLLMRYMLRL